MTDFGTDFSAIDDLDANLSVASDVTSFAQALVRRITTPRGAIWYAPAYGYDVGAHVNSGTEPAVIEAAAEAELLNDERVENVTVTLTVIEPADQSLTDGKTWSLDIRPETAEGPYAFTLTVDAVTGVLLLGEVG